MTEKLTYSSYLKVKELLELQQVRSDPEEHDEMLFIVIHQVYELWFKLLLHEFGSLATTLQAGQLYPSISTLKRCRTVMKTLVSQLDILETMTPMSFASFRDRLETASGFQSVQFREFEFALGYKRPEMVEHHNHDPEAVAILEERLAAPSLLDAFHQFLKSHDVDVPQELLERDYRQPTEPNAAMQEQLVAVYHDRPDLSILLELLIDFDEGLQEWRYRHVKMVERTIGNKHGTGGSMGVAFLQKTVFKSLFPDLWAIRHKF